MVNCLKNSLKIFIVLAAAGFMTACGSDSSSTPTTVPESATVFYAHNLVFDNNTTLLSTGYNAFGQLGTGDLGNRSTPVPVAGGMLFKDFATGGDHSVAFTNNSTVSWGYNGFGQLGNGSTTYSSTPVKSGDLRGVTAVAAGLRHSLALRSDDTLWSWGSNDSGQLGVDMTTTASDGYISKVPVQVTGGGAAVLTNITAIAANAYHSLALAGGDVWTWGLNANGQLGIDPAVTTKSAAPVKVPIVPAGGIVGIAAGGAFNYAVANDGTLWAWGYNGSGQLGNGTTVQSFTPVKVMKDGGQQLNNEHKVVKVAAGLQHGLALLADNSVWAWGYGVFGQLGVNSKLDSNVAKQVFESPNVPLTGVTDIRAFGHSSMARKNGVWYVWGDSSYGQLGTGGTGTLLLPVRMSGF